MSNTPTPHIGAKFGDIAESSTMQCSLIMYVVCWAIPAPIKENVSV